MADDMPAAPRAGFVAEDASHSGRDRILAAEEGSSSSNITATSLPLPNAASKPRAKMVRMTSHAIHIAPKAMKSMSRLITGRGGRGSVGGLLGWLKGLNRRRGRSWRGFTRMDSKIAGDDDGERDCIFELANLCFPSLKYRGNMTEPESEAYQMQLKSMSLQMKMCVLLYDLFLAAIDPSSLPRVMWDIIVMSALLYVAVMVPFYVAFEVTPAEDAQPLWVADKVVDMLFVCDILLNFRFAYEDRRTKKVVQNHKKIAKKYLSSWFAVDLLSSIPIDWILGGQVGIGKTAQLTKLAKFARILKITKLLRLVKVPTMINGLERMFGRTGLKMGKILVICVFVAHIMACFFYFSATLPLGTDWRGKPNWRCDELGECDPGYERDVLDDYITALFWSFTTITTVGYGDVVPSNMYERIIAILCMVAGVAVFGYFMGAMSSMVQQMNMSKQKDREREEAVEAFLAYRDLPEQMCERIKAYYSFVWTRDLREEEKKWLLGLSGGLRTEAVLYMYQDALKRIPFFHNKHPQFIADMVLHLRPETYGPCDIVSRQGDPASCMYFVSRGTLDCCEQVSDVAAQDLLQKRCIENLDDSGDINIGGPDSLPKVIPSEQSSTSMERDARRKVLQTMSVHNIRGYKNKAKQLQGGVLKKGSVACDDNEDSVEDSLKAGAHSRHSKPMVYVIPDNSLYRIHMTRRISRPSTSRKKAVSSFMLMPDKTDREEEYDEYGAHLQDQSFEHLLALSRRATEVNSDLEMIEAFQLMGGHAVPFSRVGVIRPGMYFGEYACLLGTRQSITVVAAEFCEVYALKRTALEYVIKDWPNVEEEFRQLVTASSKDSDKGHASAERRFANKQNLQSMLKKAKNSLFASVVTNALQTAKEDVPGSVELSSPSTGTLAPGASVKKGKAGISIRRMSRRMSQNLRKKIELPDSIQGKLKGTARLVKLKQRTSLNAKVEAPYLGPSRASMPRDRADGGPESTVPCPTPEAEPHDAGPSDTHQTEVKMSRETTLDGGSSSTPQTAISPKNSLDEGPTSTPNAKMGPKSSLDEGPSSAPQAEIGFEKASPRSKSTLLQQTDISPQAEEGDDTTEDIMHPSQELDPELYRAFSS